MKPHYIIPPVPGSTEAQELLAMEAENASATPWPGSNPNKANEEFISPAEKEKFLKKKTHLPIGENPAHDNGMWELSLYADRQMELDPHWHESDEGSVLLNMVKRENDRLRRTVNCLQCDKPINHTQGTCPHCGYKEF